MSIADDLQDILSDVQSRFTYVSDIERWKTPEYWISHKDGDLLEAKWDGDCDDHALLCRAKCREQNIPNRLVFCCVPEANGYHLVTEVKGHIMDNRYPFLMTQSDLNYEWIEMSGYEKGDDWHWIKPFNETTVWPHLR